MIFVTRLDGIQQSAHLYALSVYVLLSQISESGNDILWYGYIYHVQGA